jgi:hypothetical protein
MMVLLVAFGSLSQNIKPTTKLIIIIIADTKIKLCSDVLTITTTTTTTTTENVMMQQTIER